MKICILTPRYPFPENGGDVLRINGIARYLKEKGFELSLISFINKNQKISDKDYEIYDHIYTVKLSKITSIINSLFFFINGKSLQCGYYYSRKFKKELLNILKINSFDLFISHLVRMECYLDECNLVNKSIIEMTDALSKTYSLSSASEGISFKKFIYKLEKSRIKKTENDIITKYPKVVLVSKNDIDYLGRKESLSYHTNGIKIYKNSSQYNINKICFVGNMRTLQNQDAVISFIINIFPLIKKENKDAEFHIVGAEPPASIRKLENSVDIFVTGFVDSVEEYIKDSCLLVAPVKIAAGIQNKVLVGMACKIPVVLTSLIAEAIIGLKSGENCFIEDEYTEFAEKCLTLMKDKNIREKIARNGLSFVEEFYSWNKTLEGYENINE